MSKISIDSTLEEIDTLLKKRYGYGYWHFADSLFSVYVHYKWKDAKEYLKLAQKRINKIENIRQKIIEYLDSFLTEIDFVELSKYHSQLNKRGFIWTPNNRRNLIISKFHLKAVFSELDKMINEYRDNPELLFDTDRVMYIKPINLIILIWSNVLKNKERIEWINLEALLKWFLKIMEEIGVLDIFKIENKRLPSPQRMRLIYNRYKGTDLRKLAYFIYYDSFLDKEKIAEQKKQSIFEGGLDVTDYSDPMKYLDKFLWLVKRPEGWLKFADLGVFFELIEDR